MKYLTVTCAIVLLFFACQTDPWDNHIRESGQAVGASLLDVVQENPEWSNFYQALATTGYDTLLQSANTYTVFVPVNSAWASVKMSDVNALKKIVANHIAYEKRLSTDDRLQSESLRMISGKRVSYNAETQSLNGAKVTSPDHVASNGVLHVTNKLVEALDNVWDNINKIRSNSQVTYLKSLGHREMDMERSVQTGVNMAGQPVYDTVWADVNDFLKETPLNDEAREWTYVVLKDEGFGALYEKYKPYFKMLNDPGETLTASVTSLSICRDFVFEGRIDIRLHDTITGIYGVKTPVKDARIDTVYECSNGRVYVIDKSNILLREKIKPVIIEGENFVSASDKNFIYKRYKQWASGDYDIMLSGQTKQTDTVFVLDSVGARIPSLVTGKDSVKAETKTFTTPGSAEASRANVNNFYVEYKAPVNSVSYNIYYVAFDDIGGFSSDANHIMRIEQKLFISMPGKPTLKKGNSASADAVTNGYLNDTICFVGIDTAGVHRETQLKQWTLEAKTQFLKRPLTTPQAAVMVAPNVGELTLWLCNTTRRNATREQGIMFLDYIKLVPILNEE